MMPDKIQTIARHTERRLAPHELHTDPNGLLWETMSYPWEEPYGKSKTPQWVEKIKVRVPGDPTTLRDIDTSALTPLKRFCLCYEVGEHWFRDPQWMAEQREALNP